MRTAKKEPNRRYSSERGKIISGKRGREKPGWLPRRMSFPVG